MSGKKIGLVWMVCGGILIILSLAADLIGLGSESGIGWKQLLGAGVGVVAFLIGFGISRFKGGEKK